MMSGMILCCGSLVEVPVGSLQAFRNMVLG